MQVLTKKACYSMITNDTYLCIFGNTLDVYIKEGLKLVCSFSDMRNFNCVHFMSKNEIIAKNTEGLFRVYDIDSKECMKRIVLKNVERVAQDSKFILSHNNKYLFDVLGEKMPKENRFYKINIDKVEYDCTKMGEDVRVIGNILYDQTTDVILVMHSRAAGEVDGELKGVCNVTRVDYHKMDCSDIYENYYPIANGPILFFQNKYILYENMEIVDISTNQVVGKINYDYKRSRKVYFSKDYRYLFFIFSDRIIVFDYINNEIANEYTGKFCSHAEILGEKIIIGTWEKVTVFDFPNLNL